MAKKKKAGSGRGKSRKKAAEKKKAAPRKKAAGKKTARKKSGGKKAAGKRTGGKKAAGKRAAGKKTGGKKAAGKKTAGKKTPRKKAAGKKAARKSTGRAPARRPSRTKAGTRGAAFFDHFRQRLLDQRQEITRRLDELREELAGLEQAPPRELEEWAQEEKDRDILIRLEERETDELRRIQAALGLIDSGEYGRCQNCGKPIPRARLEELPTAFRCIDCTP